MREGFPPLLLFGLALPLLVAGCAERLVLSPWDPPPSEAVRQDPLQAARRAANPQDQLAALRVLKEDAPRLPTETQSQIEAELQTLFRGLRQPYLRIAVLDTLAAYPGPRAEETLWLGLDDPDSSVRLASCRAWATRGGPTAVEALGQALHKEDDLDVRLNAARGLGQIPGEASEQALARALDDRDPAVQYRAVLALQEITDHPYGGDIAAWRDYYAGRTPEPRTPSIAERIGIPLFR